VTNSLGETSNDTPLSARVPSGKVMPTFLNESTPVTR
jgi:hypothetical protein